MMSVECEECTYRYGCAKTLNECRSHGGGQRDLYIIIERQKEEIERLKNELSKAQAEQMDWDNQPSPFKHWLED